MVELSREKNFRFAEKNKIDILRELFFTGKHSEKISSTKRSSSTIKIFTHPLHSQRRELEKDRWFNCDFTFKEMEDIMRFIETSGKSLNNVNLRPKMMNSAGHYTEKSFFTMQTEL